MGALEDMLQQNTDLKGLTIKPDGSQQFQFNPNVAPAAQPVAPRVAPQVGQASSGYNAISKMLGGNTNNVLSPIYQAGTKLGDPAMLNMLATIAQAIDPEGTWSSQLGGAIKQRTGNQLYNTMLQKILQQAGGTSPFPQAPQQ